MTIRAAVLAFLVSFTAITGWLMTRKPADIHYTSPPSSTAQASEKATTEPDKQISAPADEVIALSDAERYVLEKLKRVIIPEIVFENTSVEEAIDYLRLRAHELDPADDHSRKSVSFIIHHPPNEGNDGWGALDAAPLQEAKQRNPTITGELKNKNLIEVLDFISSQAHMRWEITDRGILLTPLD